MSHIARLNPDGTLDAAFNPGLGANDTVFSLALQSDNRIVVGGEFTRFSGVSRNRITRLNPDGTVDPTINFGTGANDFVAAIVMPSSLPLCIETPQRKQSQICESDLTPRGPSQ